MEQFPDEALTEQFYAWEKRGRGWRVYDYPVVLEPPFIPFIGHCYVPPETQPQDAAAEYFRRHHRGISQKEYTGNFPSRPRGVLRGRPRTRCVCL